MRLHEALARAWPSAAAWPVARQASHRLRRQPAAEHRVVDALAGGRRDDAGGVAGQQHVAAVVPALGSGFSGIGAPSRRIVSAPLEAGCVPQARATEPRSEKPLQAEPVPMLAVSPCGNIQP